VLKNTGDLKKLMKQRKKYKRKLSKAKRYNHHYPDRMMVEVGSWWKIGGKQVDAEDHFTKLIDDMDAGIRDIQAYSKKSNLGVAFISFKQRDCVTETLEEIGLVKLNLMADKKTEKLGI
jgi:hypothetical protein